MWNWLGTRPGQIVLLLVFLLAPLVLALLLGVRVPSWDNCTFGGTVPC